MQFVKLSPLEPLGEVIRFLILLFFRFTAASRQKFGMLTEYQCFDTARGLYTTPDGVTMDRGELSLMQMPPDFLNGMFGWAGIMQALKLTPFQDHLLKSILLFNPGKLALEQLPSAYEGNVFSDVCLFTMGFWPK